MNKYVAFGIFGIISGLVAALADVPLVKPGKSDRNEGIPLNGVNTWWADVTPQRFKISFWLSFLGQPGAYITMWLLADLISKESNALAVALKINTFIGCYTGLLCHIVFCIKPLLYQKLSSKMSDNESMEIMNSFHSVTMVPMFIGALSLWLGGTILVAAAIVTGALAVPKACLLLNPIVSLVALMVLKKCKVRTIGALGVGYLLFSILLIIAGA